MKHLKKFATDVAVLSVGLLAGVQVALPLWQATSAQDAFALSSMADWTAAVPTMMPLQRDEGMVYSAPDTMSVTLPPPPQPSVMAAPVAFDAATDSKDMQIQMLTEQLAEAQLMIQALQMQLEDVLNGQGAAPEVLVPLPIVNGHDVDTLSTDDWMATPVAPSEEAGFLCEYFGLAC